MVSNVYIVLFSIGSWLSGLDPAWIALIGTLFGGAGLKAIEYYLSRSRVRLDDAAQIRNELRTEVTELRNENRELEKSRDEWREKYWDQREEFLEKGLPHASDVVE